LAITAGTIKVGTVQTVYLSFSEGDRRLSRIPDREFEKNQIAK